MKLSELKQVHVLGVCGTLMAPFAAYLKRMGIQVTGTDQNVYPPMSDVLAKAGVQVFSGYKAENLDLIGNKPDLVIVGNVIGATNPEMMEVQKRGWNFTSLPEALEKLVLHQTNNLVVAGTHGKTTTSSLLSFVLQKIGKDPSYFIGGVSKDLPFSFNISQNPASKFFVLEGDEYHTAFWDRVPKFLHYVPTSAIFTSLEYDHADIYSSLDALKTEFISLMQILDKKGFLVACADYEAVREVIQVAGSSIFTYGLKKESNPQFRADSIVMDSQVTQFVILENEKPIDQVRLKIPGEHNVLNAMAVYILCLKLGMPMDQVKQALSEYQGVKRRQDVVFKSGNCIIVDDFAHHPTAVLETLKALRRKYSTHRLVAVFEPRSNSSRRKIFQEAYSQAFDEADVTYVSVPFDQTKIPTSDQFSSDQLVADIKTRGKSAFLFRSVEEGVDLVSQASLGSDCIVILSNGGFGGFIEKLGKRIQQRMDADVVDKTLA